MRPRHGRDRRVATRMDAEHADRLPPVTLIICSRNRPQLLGETVESVLRGAEIPAEILIVDQSERPHPTLGCYTPARPCALRYRWSHSRGLSRARTIAIREARHNILVFLDDDMLVPEEWFGTLVRALLAAGPRAVVTGQVQPTVAEVRGGFQLSIKVDPEPAVYRGRIGRDELAGGHMAAYRSVITAVGGFDS